MKDVLTKVAAQRRAELIANPVYTTTLRLSDNAKQETFESEVTVEFDCTQPGQSSFIDLVCDDLVEARLNGVLLDPSKFADLQLTLDALKDHNILTVKSTHRYADNGVGLTRVFDPEDGEGYIHTQFEHFYAHKAFVCFDQPSIKGRFNWAVEAPTGWQKGVLANDPQTTTRDLGGGISRTEFAKTETITTYASAVVAGPFESFHDVYVSTDGRSIPLGLYVRQSQAPHVKNDVAEIFDITKRALRFFEEDKQRPYPFVKYDQVAVPGFKAGAMENVGLVTFAEQVIIHRGISTDSQRERREEVIFHEADHMWDGNLWTMKWWVDTWLNEASASDGATRGQLAAGLFGSKAIIGIDAAAAVAATLDERRSNHPVAPPDVADTSVVRTIFDPLTYRKGNAVLRQLRAYIGEDAAARVTKRFGDLYAWKNATAEDRFAVIQRECSDKDIDGWIKQWLTSKGVSVLTPSFDLDAGKMRNFVIEQTFGENADKVYRAHVLNIALYDIDAKGRLQLRKKILREISGASTIVTELEGESEADLVLVNENALTYAKVHLDAHSSATVASHLSTIDDATTRSQLWTALWHMVRDADMPARTFVELAVKHCVRETEVSVLEKTIARTQAAIERYADPTARDGLREQLALASKAKMNEKGLDRSIRIAWLNTYLATALVRDSGKVPAHEVTYVRNLLDGTLNIPDVKISADVNLRWKTLTALAGAGAIGEKEIAEEAARDRSVQGESLALAARASLPSAKQWGYTYLVDPKPGDAPMTPQNMRGVVAGFAYPGQDAARVVFTKDFAATVDRLCRDRIEEEATDIVSGILPEDATSENAISDALQSKHINPSVARVLRDAQDDLQRLRKARARDAKEGPLQGRGRGLVA